MANLVKMFDSRMLGAPILSNTQGSLISLLDACLITGFSLTTLSKIEASAGVATATIAGSNPYQVGQIVAINGAVQAEYNGDHTILSVSGSQFTYAVSGNPISPAGTQSTLSAKVSPLGWEKPFSANNKAAYRSKSSRSNRHFLRVDDSVKTTIPPFTGTYDKSWAKYAYVGAVENMSDIDTLLGSQAPYDPFQPNKNWQQNANDSFGWGKWYYARNLGYDNNQPENGDRAWTLIGDDRLFFIMPSAAPASNFLINGGRYIYAFGDIESVRKGDAYNTLIKLSDNIGRTNANPPTNTGQTAFIQANSSEGLFLLKDSTQVGYGIRAAACALTFNLISSTPISGNSGARISFPNVADQSLWLSPYKIVENIGDGDFVLCSIRGDLPGLHFMPQPKSYPDGSIIDNLLNEAPGTRVMLFNTQAGSTSAQLGISINGVWRE